MTFYRVRLAATTAARTGCWPIRAMPAKRSAPLLQCRVRRSVVFLPRVSPRYAAGTLEIACRGKVWRLTRAYSVLIESEPKL